MVSMEVGGLIGALTRKGVIGHETDLSTLKEDKDSGIYGFYMENGLPIGIPDGLIRGAIIVANQQGNLLQIICCYEQNKIYRRVGIMSGFKGWEEM